MQRLGNRTKSLSKRISRRRPGNQRDERNQEQNERSNFAGCEQFSPSRPSVLWAADISTSLGPPGRGARGKPITLIRLTSRRDRPGPLRTNGCLAWRVVAGFAVHPGHGHDKLAETDADDDLEWLPWMTCLADTTTWCSIPAA